MPYMLLVQVLPEAFHRKNKDYKHSKKTIHKQLKLNSMKRLTRSNEKLVAGVISGISNYINPKLDPIFLRLAFVWITFFNPALILIYLGLVLIIPVENLEFRNREANYF